METNFYRIDDIQKISKLHKLILRNWDSSIKTWVLTEFYVSSDAELNKNDLIKVETDKSHVIISKVDKTSE